MAASRLGVDVRSPGVAKGLQLQAKAIADLKLEKYALELEMNGLTVVPPEVTGVTLERVDKMVELLLARGEELTGLHFDLDGGVVGEIDYSNLNLLGLAGQGIGGEPPPKLTQIQIVQLAQLDRVFRDLAINPAALALVRQMVGHQDTRLSSTNSFIKWKGGGYGSNLGMHCDQSTPLPWGRIAMNANVNWCLTDYTKEGGAFAYVPGSHLRHHHPVFPAAVVQAVPVEAKRGSAIVFHGQLWHGAFPKKTDGLRVTISNYYRHATVVPQEDVQNTFPRDLAKDCDDPQTLRGIIGFDASYTKQTPFLLVRAKKGAGKSDGPPAARL